MDEKIKQQYGIEYVKNMYKNENIDIIKNQNQYITKSGIKMLALSLVGAITAVIVSYLTSKLSAKFGRDLRKNIVEKVMTFGNKEMKEIGSSSLITRSTNDINRVQMTLDRKSTRLNSSHT